MCIEADLDKMETTKLNRNAEKMPSANTNDFISENDHSLIKKLAENGKGTLGMIDMLFPPLGNFHTSEYKSISNRWG